MGGCGDHGAASVGQVFDSMPARPAVPAAVPQHELGHSKPAAAEMPFSEHWPVIFDDGEVEHARRLDERLARLAEPLPGGHPLGAIEAFLLEVGFVNSRCFGALPTNALALVLHRVTQDDAAFRGTPQLQLLLRAAAEGLAAMNPARF